MHNLILNHRAFLITSSSEFNRLNVQINLSARNLLDFPRESITTVLTCPTAISMLVSVVIEILI